MSTKSLIETIICIAKWNVKNVEISTRERIVRQKLIVIPEYCRHMIFLAFLFNSVISKTVWLILNCIPSSFNIDFTTSMTGSASIIIIKRLWTKADGTAMTTEHYGTGAAHYDHSLLATTQLFLTGLFPRRPFEPGKQLRIGSCCRRLA